MKSSAEVLFDSGAEGDVEKPDELSPASAGEVPSSGVLDCRHCVGDSGRRIAVTECGDQVVVDDLGRGRVIEERLESRPDLDPHAMVVPSDEHEHAVVFAALPDPPFPPRVRASRTRSIRPRWSALFATAIWFPVRAWYCASIPSRPCSSSAEMMLAWSTTGALNAGYGGAAAHAGCAPTPSPTRTKTPAQSPPGFTPPLYTSGKGSRFVRFGRRGW